MDARAAPGMAPPARHVSQTLAFVLATTATALVVEDLGKVFQLVGSTAGVLVICWVPAALLLVPPPAARASDAAAADETREARGASRAAAIPGARARATGRTAAGASAVSTTCSCREWPRSAPVSRRTWRPRRIVIRAGCDAPLLAASGAGVSAPRVYGNRGRMRCRRRRAADARRGLGLVLLGLVIAVSNVYLLLFTGEKDVTGEDPTAPAVLDRRTNAGFERK